MTRRAASDEELASCVAAGDRAAFDELVARHLQSLFRFAALTCGSRVLAERALEEALSTAWSQAASAAGEPGARTWLFRTVVEACHRLSAPAAPDGDESRAGGEPEGWVSRVGCPTCEQVQARLSEYLDDAVEEGERARFEQHLRACLLCGRAATTMRAMLESLHDLHVRESLPADSRERLLHTSGGKR